MYRSLLLVLPYIVLLVMGRDPGRLVEVYNILRILNYLRYITL
jgi:hypothetical protein